MTERLFDEFSETYDRWFTTPIGALVRQYEQSLVLDLLEPGQGELILDAGCGTGIFTRTLIEPGAQVVGLDISAPMIRHARRTLSGASFTPIVADMLALPFDNARFDKVLSVTALEFIEDAGTAIEELLRVTRPQGCMVIATLNSLSPWATRRSAEARANAQSIFKAAYFRSPEQLRKLVPGEGRIKTAVHFAKDTDPARARKIEAAGQEAGADTGAFVIGRWEKD
jgi:ubiquinone/menaquinone biosynthesis C-methylase UbiE